MEKFIRYTGITLIILLIMAFSLSIIIPGENTKINGYEEKPLDYGWFNIEKNRTIPTSELIILPGETVNIKRRVDKAYNEGLKLCYKDPGSHIICYSNGRKIYEAGLNGHEKFGQEVSNVWRCISLQGIKEKSEIRLEIENNTSHKMRLDFTKMFYCNEELVYLKILQESTFHLFIFFFCLTAFITIIIFSFGLKVSSLKKYCKTTFPLAGLTICIGLWVISDSTFLQLFFHSPSVRYYLAYSSFFLIPYFLILHYMGMTGENRKPFIYLINSYCLIVFIILVINLLNLIHISKSIFVIYGYLIIALIALGIICIRQYIKFKVFNVLLPFICYILLFILIVIALLFYYFVDRGPVSIAVGMGFIIYNIATQIVGGFHILKQIKNTPNTKTDAE